MSCAVGFQTVASDNLGVRGKFSSAISTLRLLSLVVLSMLLMGGAPCQAQVEVSWDAVSHEALGGYKVHYGIQPGVYENTVDAGLQTSVELQDIESDKVYYIAVTAYGSAKSSGYSTEMLISIPGVVENTPNTPSTEQLPESGGNTELSPEITEGSSENSNQVVDSEQSAGGSGNQVSESTDGDSDGDGVSDAEELKLGTDCHLADSDRDGIFDGQELLDGTDPLDKGSCLLQLNTTVCAEWNGFLGGMYNIFEHVNMSSHRLRVRTVIYSIQGEALSHIDHSIDAGGQFDVLVHDMLGWQLNSVGQVCSTHDGEQGDLDGRMVYYRPEADGSTDKIFEFAVAMPLLNGVSGSQFVPFNTYQPSLSLTDADDRVANWIQITNLGAEESSGELYFYAEDGQVIGQQHVTLAAGARGDFSGHQFGPSKVGLIEWRPETDRELFQVRNVRYFYDNPQQFDSFDTALSVEGMVGNGRDLAVPLDSDKASTVLEISNTLNKPTSVNVDFYDTSGLKRDTWIFTLKARSSRHIIVDPILQGASGMAIVHSNKRNSLIAMAMHYVRTEDGGIRYMYGVRASEALAATMRGSFNTFLQQRSWLLLSNASDQELVVQLQMTRSVGARDSFVSEEVVLAASGSRKILLNDYLVGEEYGVVTASAEREQSLIAWVVRERENEYVVTTPVR